MGIEVAVEDERGRRVASLADPANILHRLLPAHVDPRYRCLNRVDWYGDTTFNRFQIPDVQEELRRLIEGNRAAEEVRLLEQISALATKCQSDPHLYLKFYGD
jgi:hypothetical protein